MATTDAPVKHESAEASASTLYQKTAEAVLDLLGSDATTGLSETEVSRRRQQHGLNELVETARRGPLQILWEQLSGALVVLLFGAALVSLYLREYVDACAILAIVVLNAALGFVQDYRAEKALAALKKLTVPKVRARRDGRLKEIASTALVPGDILLLEAGNYVPADCRLLESVNLKTQEASLTGESAPVEKTTEPLASQDLVLGDRRNMAYMGTTVVYGHAQAIVTATGMNTELGAVAHSLQTVTNEPTPLQRRLAQLGRNLAIMALGIVAIVFAVGVLRGEDLKLMLITSLSMAVAIVPEGLPAVATVALALGARRMFRREALIRKLPAVETLGSVTVICSDKTGTLTENQMTVAVLDVAGQRIEVVPGSTPAAAAATTDRSSLSLLLAGASLCNDAELAFDRDKNEYESVGDPTESALVLAAARMGFVKSELTKVFPRVDEIPFDSDRKTMTTLHEVAGGSRQSTFPPGLESLLDLDLNDRVAFTKGAVDRVLETCRFVWTDDQPQPLDDHWRARISSANDQLAAGGMRVLGLAFRPVDQSTEQDEIESHLIFVGLLGMMDPPRPEARGAVERCRAAGIRPIMITGDHPLTALQIAKQLGITNDQRVLSGRELDNMSKDDLEKVVGDVTVYARVAPADKLSIVGALQNRGEVVAMTGDGVNDAPALKQAHIGVAMGITGTDVSKEAAEMVLLDDNFATIVGAVEEGRMVYDNIRKFVKYTMTSNAGEICVMVLGPLLGMPLPLLPLQILWINLVTDGLPGLALAVEPSEDDTMRRPPYPPNENIFGRGMTRDIAWIGLLMGIASLALGYWYWVTSAASHEHWRTIVFTVLTLSQMGNAMAIRSSRRSLFHIGLFSNKPLLASVVLTFLLQMAVIYLPALQTVFSTTALSVPELLLCLAFSSIVFLAVEVQKLFTR